MLYFIFLLIITAVLLIAWGIKGPQKESRFMERLSPQNQRKSTGLRILLKPIAFFSQILISRLKMEDALRDKINAARAKLTAVEFFSLKLVTIIVLLLIAFFGFGRLDPIRIVVCIALGYIVPDFWMKRKVLQRKAAIARMLPETIDLLGLCIEAGLDFTTAMHWVIEKTRSTPLIEELSFVLEEVRWGKPRIQALRDMARRLSIPEVSSFVQTLVQADRMGTPVAEAFTILSEDTRMQRFQRGERIALQAPIKILVPLIFCILPVIGIIIGGPILLQFMQGGLFKF